MQEATQAFGAIFEDINNSRRACLITFKVC